MKLIIGGAFQGKLDYAKKTYTAEEGWVDGTTCSFEDLEVCRGINQFHEFVKRHLDYFSTNDLSLLEQQAEKFADWICTVNPEIVIISNELGYGVVPMEKTDRIWREAAGRSCTCLAQKADEVVRVVCGIGMQLK